MDMDIAMDIDKKKITLERIIHMPGITLAYIKIYKLIYKYWVKGEPTSNLKNYVLLKVTGLKSTSTLRRAFAFFEKNGELMREFKGGCRYFTRVKD